MIDPEERFFSDGQMYFGPPEDPTTKVECNVWDWDQLRMVRVKGTTKLLVMDEDVEIPILARIADYLSPEVLAITVDDEGLLVGISMSSEDDASYFVPYLPYELVKSRLPPGCCAIERSQLHDVDRLGVGVDLLSYQDRSCQIRKVAFKFNPIAKPLRLQMAWDELNLWSRLPPHPNIVPFDQIVLDDVESRVLGFTTKYIPGGTLTNPEIPFRFEWLQQLTQLVDFLNLELGIIHQDIAPRNLIIDPETDKILLFDFDWAARASKKETLLEGRDDVSGVIFTIYELVTNDTHMASIPHWDRTIDTVQDIEWPCNRESDSDVSTIRDFLNKWLAKRRSDNDSEEGQLNAPRQITWPDMPTPPDYDIPFKIGMKNGEPTWRTGPRRRRTAFENGQFVYRWERPPQRRLLTHKERGLENPL